MNTQEHIDEQDDERLEPTKPHDYLDENADRFPDHIIETAREICNLWDGWQYRRSGPNVTAAMAVYYAYGSDEDSPTQDDVARTFGATPISVRNSWDTVKDDVDLEELSEVLGRRVRAKK